MSITKNLLEELKEEAVVTRKMLALVPADKYDWRPHNKSMSIKELAGHIADLPGWVSLAFISDEMNFATSGYTPPVWDNKADLLGLFEKEYDGAIKHLENANDDDLLPRWLLKNGDDILFDTTKGGLIRHSLSQIIHHRAQLGVYLRLLDIPIPGTYGPSADEPSF
jgi:uncharacterized damage-inducible protein DinB